MSTIHQEDLFELVQAPIDVPALHRRVRGPEDGAIVIFDGFVRNESHGRATKFLDYEAYEPMALSKIREIGAQLHQKFAIRRVAIVHRLGRLEIGETSILIAVSAAHRAAAFRDVIETRDPSEIDHVLGGRQPQLHQWNEAHAAGQDLALTRGDEL